MTGGVLGSELGPQISVDIGGNSPKKDITVHTGVTTMYPGMHIVPSTGTYGNGRALGGVDAGDNSAAEKIMRLMEFQKLNDTNNEAWDEDPASVPGKEAEEIICIEGQDYWLKVNNKTIAEGQMIIRAANGLFDGVTVTQNATPIPKLCFQCRLAITAKNWVKGRFLGMRPVYSAGP